MATATQGTPAVGWDGHLLLLHRSEAERGDAVAEWVRHGLESDERVIYAERPEESPERSLLGVLHQRGLDTAAAVDEGRLVVLPVGDFYPREGQAALVDRALDEGFHRVRLSAEARVALSKVAQDDYEHYEDAMDVLCATRPVSALCQYDQGSTTGWWLRRATGSHLGGLRETQLRSTPATGGLCLVGSVDLSNDRVLEAVLQQATGLHGEPGAASPDDDLLWLDVRALDFIDVAGCRALARSTERFRRGGGGVVLVAPKPVVDRTLHLMGVDEMPGVAVVTGRP